MVELVDTTDLKSVALELCNFKKEPYLFNMHP